MWNDLQTNYKIVGTCGLYCGACGLYQTSVKSAMECITQVCVGSCVKEETVFCCGCGDKKPNSWSSNCTIGLCAESKNYRYCFQCTEFPCHLIQDFSEQHRLHRTAILNLKRIKEIGLKKWLSESDEKFRCKSCRSRIQYYQSQCNVCGTRFPPVY